MKKTLKDVNFTNKKTLLRVDFNVPMKNNKITDTNRIVKALPTIKYLQDQNAKIILLSHLGRVKTIEDTQSKSLAPVAKKLEELLGTKVTFFGSNQSPEIEDAINKMTSKSIILLENTRFQDLDGKKESKNDPALGRYWASLGDIFVNDAFGTAHRAHASNVGIASNIKTSCIGFLVQKELEEFAKVMNNPKTPYIPIVGGAKVSDKIALLDSLLKLASKVIVGGGMAYTFLKAQGYEIGSSLVEDDKIELAKEYLEKYGNKIVLPIDHSMSKDFSDSTPTYSEGPNVTQGYMALDIGPKTIELFSKTLNGVGTVVWNGPMGVFEFKNYSNGTLKIAQHLASLKNATIIIGGGDSAAAVISLGYEDKFTYISTGGGASLELLEGKVLPGIEAIQNKK